MIISDMHYNAQLPDGNSYDAKAENRKFPVGSWVLRYYPPAAPVCEYSGI